MSVLTIIADIRIKPGEVEPVLASFRKLIPQVLPEPGCLQYDLHQNNDDPTHLLFYENWETRELWLDHMETAHLAAHKAATEGKVVSTTIYEMTKL
ncbi:putative quinol monooxygenase [Tropicimonas sp. IMCC6043]|uniref:putative quinol monooxygenase n=1 Tax=Tropicimonas sp. IMCC6043 TaxID=2510645 RepID=UPI00101CA318|nr:antibiotic biosynthesis monooxygenase family protein [Tropicimonas sp. IMCC6043]RYH11573.1 antibiotic biosynthesis monooxygenase [Tropicimonas sp. IMCC6043]